MNLPLRLHRGFPDADDNDLPKSWDVGVDLGSTYSSVAFRQNPDDTNEDLIPPHDIQKVTNYPKARNKGSGKTSHCEVPTELYYRDNKSVLCGYEAVEAKKSPTAAKELGVHIALFKPQFDDREHTRKDQNRIEDALARFPGDKTVDRVAIDFLCFLLTHTKSRMILSGYNARDTIHLTCTVPAIWPLRAKRRTLNAFSEACISAGIRIEKNISIWTEPEAATAYVLATDKTITWNEGDTFTLLDAGGITVDIVTYTILGLSPLRLKEVVRGDGISCGATDLNKRFVTHVRDRLSTVREQLEAAPNSKSFEKHLHEADNHFEHVIKSRYNGVEQEPEWLPVYGLPEDDEKGFELSEMKVTSDHLESVFKPVLDTSWNLIQSQLDSAYRKSRKPTRLICVGGLSCSDRFQLHIRQMITYYVARTRRSKISCIFPPYSDFAIAAGAVCRSLNTCVVEDYVSRSSIAICRHEIYQPRSRAHKDAQPVFDELEQRDYVQNCMELLLKMDEVVPSTGLRKTSHLHRTIECDEDIVHLSITILESDDPEVAENFPIAHSRNKGKLHALEEVSFNIDVSKLHGKAEKKNSKDTGGCAEPVKLRKSTRLRNRNPGHGFEAPWPRVSEDRVQTPDTETSTSTPFSMPAQENSGTLEDPGIDYYWVNYQLDVEFQGMFMEYELKCPVTGGSEKGKVNLAPILEPWAADG